MEDGKKLREIKQKLKIMLWEWEKKLSEMLIIVTALTSA